MDSIVCSDGRDFCSGSVDGRMLVAAQVIVRVYERTLRVGFSVPASTTYKAICLDLDDEVAPVIQKSQRLNMYYGAYETHRIKHAGRKERLWK